MAAALVLSLVTTGVQAAAPSVQAEWKTEAAAFDLTLMVTLEPGWHVNAHDPDQPYLIPTVLEVAPPAGTKVDSIRYPEAVVHRLAFAPDTSLRLYAGTFAIVVRFAGPRPERFEAHLSYQACNAERCLPPRTLDVPYAAKDGKRKP